MKEKNWIFKIVHLNKVTTKNQLKSKKKIFKSNTHIGNQLKTKTQELKSKDLMKKLYLYAQIGWEKPRFLICTDDEKKGIFAKKKARGVQICKYLQVILSIKWWIWTVKMKTLRFGMNNKTTVERERKL